MKSISIAHIINPVEVLESSDIYVAQPITFETLKIAQQHASEKVNIDIFSAQFPEDRSIIPDYINKCEDLNRSILDLSNKISLWKKLPFIKDVLDRLARASEAEYFIYTNIDIGLYKEFYSVVLTFINQGFDAIAISRRTISDGFKKINDIPQIFQESGKPHAGLDCFIFQRRLYKYFEFGNVFIGGPFFENVWMANFYRFASKVGLFRDEKLTFHIGSSSEWIVSKNDTREKSVIRSVKATNKLAKENALKVIKNICSGASMDVRLILRDDINKLYRKTHKWIDILFRIQLKFRNNFLVFKNLLRKIIGRD